MYNILSELSLMSLDLEVEYNEKKEAELLSKINKDWNSIKPAFNKIIENIKKPINSVKKERSYYG
jgi:hypothetical protein